jgi:hypothetical protein
MQSTNFILMSGLLCGTFPELLLLYKTHKFHTHTGKSPPLMIVLKSLPYLQSKVIENMANYLQLFHPLVLYGNGQELCIFIVRFAISPPLWPCIATRPLARLSLRFSSPPERRQVCLARQTLVLEAFHIHTLPIPCLWLPSRLSRCNLECLSRILFPIHPAIITMPAYD